MLATVCSYLSFGYYGKIPKADKLNVALEN